MAAIPRDKINYHKVSEYANVLIFKEFYPKTKNVSYYLNLAGGWISYAFTFGYKGLLQVHRRYGNYPIDVRKKNGFQRFVTVYYGLQGNDT